MRPLSVPPGSSLPVSFSTLKSFGASTTHCTPEKADLALLVLKSMDLTADGDTTALPPPGQNMICTRVRRLPALSSLAYDESWKFDASSGVIASSLNQIATLCVSP